ncbi:MAG: hypothetical protein ABI664_07770 [bacterium]
MEIPDNTFTAQQPVTVRQLLSRMAAGGLWGTADDLARFVIAVNQAWSGEPGALFRHSVAQGDADRRAR